MQTSPTLGTLLRSLIERLDGSVERAYQEAGLDYRPRYTPVLRSVLRLGPASIRSIATDARLTHSATSQTVAQMRNARLVRLSRGVDGREQVVALSAKARRMIPQLEAIWNVTLAAAQGLENDLPYPLSSLLQAAIEAIDRRSFDERRAGVRAVETKPPKQKASA